MNATDTRATPDTIETSTEAVLVTRADDGADAPPNPRDRDEFDKYFGPPENKPLPAAYPLWPRWDAVVVEFCGLHKPIRSWVKESGIRRATVQRRIVAQGHSPIQALTTPDQAGNCLKPLTAEYFERERRQRQKAVSGVVTLRDGRERAVHVAGIVAYGRKVLLGIFPSYGDAVLAFNTAVELLTGEYDPADKLDQMYLAGVTSAEDVKRRVREALEDAGVLAEEEVEFGVG